MTRSTFDRFRQVLGLEPIESTPPKRLALLPSWLTDLAQDRELPSWLTPTLIASEPGRRKLKAWKPRTEALSETDILSRVEFVGDEVIAMETARTLAALPAPVQDYVLSKVVFLGAGVTVFGCAGTSRLSPDARPWLVALTARSADDVRLRHLVAHEVSHVWTLDEPGPSVVAGGAIWQSALYHCDRAIVPPDLMAEIEVRRAEYQRHEEMADRLARSWGFRDPIRDDGWW
jgi:hypothetical protein